MEKISQNYNLTIKNQKLSKKHLFCRRNRVKIAKMLQYLPQIQKIRPQKSTKPIYKCKIMQIKFENRWKKRVKS